jgi:hypothetical protein
LNQLADIIEKEVIFKDDLETIGKGRLTKILKK